MGHSNNKIKVLFLLFLLCLVQVQVIVVNGIGVNWGTQCSHPLSPSIIVRMLKENGIQKVKLFDADYYTLRALGKAGIEVMVGIPNDMLSTLASSFKAAQQWVSHNISEHMSSNRVNIRYVAVGNEPFLETYNGTFLKTTFPAMQNIQAALIKAGFTQVKVTCPLNADVYGTSNDLPSGGDFRTEIHGYMMQIVKFLSDNGAPFTVNIYPFISLYSDANFPIEYAFFDGNSPAINDGGANYDNMFDANYDTLVWALQKNGFGNMPIIVGEVGWPTDGDMNANVNYAQRFMQGFMSRIAGGKGTPMRPSPIDAYLFSLIDEDEKSIQPGNFERHWGIFTFDGRPKYQLSLGTINSTLVPAKGVTYEQRQWCVLKPSVKLDDSRISPSVSYACARADCTSLGYGTSCSMMDIRGNVSYAFNSYYQKNDQDDEACGFSGLGVITKSNPSRGSCNFAIMIEPMLSGTDRSFRVSGLLLSCVVWVFFFSFDNGGK